MAAKLYRVVETTWGAAGRTEKDIGCKYKPESAAKAELKELQMKQPLLRYSLQKQK